MVGIWCFRILTGCCGFSFLVVVFVVGWLILVAGAGGLMVFLVFGLI